MAKAKSNEVTETTEPLKSAANPQSDPTTLWSPEDMARLDEQLNAVASLTGELRTMVESLDARVRTIEPLIAKLNLGDDLLPVEVARGVEPGQVYIASLQAALLGVMIANPAGMLNGRNAEAQISRCFHLAQQSMLEMIRRSQLASSKA